MVEENRIIKSCCNVNISYVLYHTLHSHNIYYKKIHSKYQANQQVLSSTRTTEQEENIS